MKIFGLQISRANEDETTERQQNIRSFVTPDSDDGARDFGANNMGGAYGYALELDKSMNSQAALISEYRNTAVIPDVDIAIEDIISESIITDENSQPVKLILDDVPVNNKIKQIFESEFEYVLQLLKFPMRAHDIFKRWYIDGQVNYHKLIDELAPEEGIQELRYIDPRNLMKVREYQQAGGDPQYSAIKNETYLEYWVYSESGHNQTQNTVTSTATASGLKIGKDSIAHCNSGMIDPSSKLILSHLHKSVRVARQMRMLEDSMIIYRVTRAPERRIFYVDHSNVPKGRKEQFMQSLIAKYKNKMTYDASTGSLATERNHLSAIEDFWMPVSGGKSGTRIETLPSGNALGVISDVEMFQEKLFRSLNVPVSRLQPDTAFVLGRSSEITRDELKYARFIARLRNRFSILFDDLLGTQMKLKGIVNTDEWDQIRSLIRYDFLRDNYFAELKDTEILMGRLNVLNTIQPYVGTYWSADWVKKNVCHQTDEDIEEMAEQMQQENEAQAEAMAAQGLNPDGSPMQQDDDGDTKGDNPREEIPKIKISRRKGNDFPTIEINGQVQQTGKKNEDVYDDGIVSAINNNPTNELMKTLIEETRSRISHKRNLKYLPGSEDSIL